MKRTHPPSTTNRLQLRSNVSHPSLHQYHPSHHSIHPPSASTLAFCCFSVTSPAQPLGCCCKEGCEGGAATEQLTQQRLPWENWRGRKHVVPSMLGNCWAVHLGLVRSVASCDWFHTNCHFASHDIKMPQFFVLTTAAPDPVPRPPSTRVTDVWQYLE